jgi:threonylcarbamoyladenosine tRNA methylthiotransferase MtaB
VPDLKQLRLSSIDAIEIDEPLFDALAHEPRMRRICICRFQSGDDMILKRMKRRHSRADAIDLCKRLRAARPEMAFGADLIAGFPTETDEMFANTLARSMSAGSTILHVFPYSPRPGTPAAKMPQVARDVVKARAARLREKGAERLGARAWTCHVGTDRDGAGRSRQSRAPAGLFTPVRIEGASPEPGRPALFNLVSRTATELVGQPADDDPLVGQEETAGSQDRRNAD